MSAVYTISKLQQVLSPVFADYKTRRWVLFGSYNKETAAPKSDIELLVDSGLKQLHFVGFLDTVQNPSDYYLTTNFRDGAKGPEHLEPSGVPGFINPTAFVQNL